MKGTQRRGSEERISTAQLTECVTVNTILPTGNIEMYEDQKGEFVCRYQGLMIIPTPAYGT